MKKLLLLQLILLVTACGESEQSSEINGKDSLRIQNPLSLDELSNNETIVKILEGEIDGHDVEMQIMVTPDKSVQGSYFYKKYEKLLPFRGRLSGDGRMKLEVYDITTNIVEYFKGRLSDDWSFQGKWFKVEQDSKSLAFNLSLKKNNKIKIPKALAGTYQLDTTGVSKKMTIREAANGKFQFQISIDASCSGVIEGNWAYLQSDKVANFYGEENCYVHFELLDNAIKIREADCLYYHGAQCGFDGTYRKTSNEINWINDFYEAEDIDSLLDY